MLLLLSSITHSLNVPKTQYQLDQEAKGLRYGNDIVSLIRKRAIIIKNDLMESQRAATRTHAAKVERKKRLKADAKITINDLKKQLNNSNVELRKTKTELRQLQKRFNKVNTQNEKLRARLEKMKVKKKAKKRTRSKPIAPQTKNIIKKKHKKK